MPDASNSIEIRRNCSESKNRILIFPNELRQLISNKYGQNRNYNRINKSGKNSRAYRDVLHNIFIDKRLDSPIFESSRKYQRSTINIYVEATC